MRMEVCGAPPSVPAGGGSSSSSSNDGSSSSSGAGAALSLSGGRGAAASSETGGLRAVLHVMPEDNEGTYAISLMRLVGDTFEFHSLYRKLRERLADITVPQSGGANAWSGR